MTRAEAGGAFPAGSAYSGLSQVILIQFIPRNIQGFKQGGKDQPPEQIKFQI